MYPYKCFNCNGSYYRCGTGEGKRCGCGGEGSKLCWEDDVVLILYPKNSNKIKINGIYAGYGRMYISDKYKNLKNGIYWSDFDLYPYIYKAYSSKNNNNYKQLCIDIVPEDHGPIMNDGVYIYCRSCYLKNIKN
jgi:hypothetical protein